MNAKNIYARFCLMLIFMLLILCSGGYAHAHSDKLIEAIKMSSQNPTIEVLERLDRLLEEDVEYHQSRGETIEANKSKALAVSIKAKIAIQSKVNPTEEDYKEIIALLKLETELWSNIEDGESLKSSLMNMKQFEARLCSLRVDNALLRAQKNPTVGNWKMVLQLSKEMSRLYYDIGYDKLAKYCLAQAKHFKALKSFYRAKENSTIENWTKTAEFFSESIKMYYEIGAIKVAKACAQELPYANKIIESLGGTPVNLTVELANAIL